MAFRKWNLTFSHCKVEQNRRLVYKTQSMQKLFWVLCHHLFSLLEISFTPLPPYPKYLTVHASGGVLCLCLGLLQILHTIFCSKECGIYIQHFKWGKPQHFLLSLSSISPACALSLSFSSRTNKINKCPWLWFPQSFFVFPSLFIQVFLTGEGLE